MSGQVWTVMDEATGFGIRWMDGRNAAQIVTLMPGESGGEPSPVVVDMMMVPADGRDVRLALPGVLAYWQQMTKPVQFHGMEAESMASRLRDKRFRTADNVLIVDGLRVWDYDFLPGTVCFRESGIDRDYWNGWFMVIRDDGSTKSMNGERLRTRHWSTYAPVTDPPDDGRVELLAALESGAVLIGDGMPVVFTPRTPVGDGDSLPWQDEHRRRFRSDEITVRAADGKPGDGQNEES